MTLKLHKFIFLLDEKKTLLNFGVLTLQEISKATKGVRTDFSVNRKSKHVRGDKTMPSSAIYVETGLDSPQLL